MKERNIRTLGQVFTTPSVVNLMLSLRKNSGRTLEPACGNGAFLAHLDASTVAIELDEAHCPSTATRQDFFIYPIHEKFSTIIGNPPYVRFQDILPSTRQLLNFDLFDRRSNLYLFFIEKCIQHLKPGGELIFITPRDFLKTTSSVRLNKWLYQQGSITDAIELGDSKIFDGAIPNCLIWRFELGCMNRHTRYAHVTGGGLQLMWQSRQFVEHNGHLAFALEDQALCLAQIADVKVGAVSGLDSVFTNAAHGTREFVCSATVKTGQTRRMIWDEEKPHPALLPHKQQLLARRIRAFDENNWWQWGRGYPLMDTPRVYVNAKTRQREPFFIHACPHFDGAVLALFPKHPKIDLNQWCADLNALDWEARGFVCNGRYLFSQRSLEQAPLPQEFERYLP